MFSFCWHRWSGWSGNIQDVLFEGDVIYHNYIQTRACKKCNKRQYKTERID